MANNFMMYLVLLLTLFITDSDVAKDGTYSGIFYPDTDGIYTSKFI